MTTMETVLLVIAVVCVLYILLLNMRLTTLERHLLGAHARITEVGTTAWLTHCKVEHWQPDEGGIVRATITPRATPAPTPSPLKETLLNETIDALVDAAQKLDQTRKDVK